MIHRMHEKNAWRLQKTPTVSLSDTDWSAPLLGPFVSARVEGIWTQTVRRQKNPASLLEKLDMDWFKVGLK